MPPNSPTVVVDHITSFLQKGFSNVSLRNMVSTNVASDFDGCASALVLTSGDALIGFNAFGKTQKYTNTPHTNSQINKKP